MRRRHVGRVVRADWVGPEPTGRLNSYEHAAKVYPREHQRSIVAIDLTGRRAPQLLNLGASLFV